MTGTGCRGRSHPCPATGAARAPVVGRSFAVGLPGRAGFRGLPVSSGEGHRPEEVGRRGTPVPGRRRGTDPARTASGPAAGAPEASPSRRPGWHAGTPRRTSGYGRFPRRPRHASGAPAARRGHTCPGDRRPVPRLAFRLPGALVVLVAGAGGEGRGEERPRRTRPNSVPLPHRWPFNRGSCPVEHRQVALREGTFGRSPYRARPRPPRAGPAAEHRPPARRAAGPDAPRARTPLSLNGPAGASFRYAAAGSFRPPCPGAGSPRTGHGAPSRRRPSRTRSPSLLPHAVGRRRLPDGAPYRKAPSWTYVN